MSRSTRQPYVSICSIGRGDMKKWKAQCNRKIRRLSAEQEIGAPKKITNRWDAPDDGRSYYDRPESRRK